MEAVWFLNGDGAAVLMRCNSPVQAGVPPAILSAPTQASDSPTLHEYPPPSPAHQYLELALAQQQQQQLHLRHSLYADRLLDSPRASSSSGLPTLPQATIAGPSRVSFASLRPPVRPSQGPRRHISSRTASAILHTLEESIRAPFAFTPDLEEENASMADLTARTTANSTAPATSNGAPATGAVVAGAAVRGPREVWRDRQIREARRKGGEDSAQLLQQLQRQQQGQARAEDAPLQQAQRDDAAHLQQQRQAQRDDSAETQQQQQRQRQQDQTQRGDSAELQHRQHDQTQRRNAAAADTTQREDSAQRQQHQQKQQQAQLDQARRNAAAAAAAGVVVSDIEARQAGTARTPRNPPGLAPPAISSSSSSRRQIQSGRDQATSPEQQQSNILPSGDNRSAPIDLPTTNATTTTTTTTTTTRPRIAQGQAQAQQLPDPFRTPPRATAAGAAATAATSSRVNPQTQGNPPQAALPSSQQPPIVQASYDQSRTTSTFPHAFERWETLSSHWEGLTSYWIRRLEQNSDEVRQEPLAQQMSRQITDLSAAGANLFHAVVELQRLRASSERKFQRWFFETRQEQETAREVLAEMEDELRRERAGKDDMLASVAQMEKDKSIAEKLVAEMRRELLISKDEARRAWEELGRREQEERERTTSLREGQPTLVGGVQVVPMVPGVSRNQSVNRPASTRDEAYADPLLGSGSQVAPEPVPPTTAADESNNNNNNYPSQYRQAGEAAAAAAAYHQTSSSPSEPQQYSASYPTTTNGIATAPAQMSTAPESMGSPASRVQYPSIPAAHPPSSSLPFYQHQGLSLQSPPAAAPTVVTREDDTRSIIPSETGTFSDTDDYALDDPGAGTSWRLDAAGRPIAVRRALPSEDSDEYDVSEDAARERAHSARYASGMMDTSQGLSSSSALPPHAPALPPQGYAGGYSTPEDYSGVGFGGAGAGWEAVPRHRHPTRLSVVEEDDERSRTSASRQSDRNGGRR